MNYDNRQIELAKLQQIATSISDTKSFMTEVVNIIQRVFNTDFVKILQFTEAKSKLKLIEGIGWNKDVNDDIIVDGNYLSQVMKTLVDKKPIIVENYDNEKRFQIPRLFQEYGIKSGMTIIISGKKKPFGILGVHSRKPKKFTPDDNNFLSSVSFIVSSVVMQQEFITSLKEEEEKYRILMEYASDAIIIFDQQGKILNVNTKISKMTKYSKEELLNKNIKDLFYEKDLTTVPIKFREVLRGENVILERNLKTKEGTGITIEISSTLLPNGTIQGIYRDISVRKETEELMRNIEKMEALERVSVSLAHDFNNYLSVINGYTEKMLLSFPNKDLDEIFQDLEQIQKIIKRSSSLTREILKFSTITGDKLELVNINDSISELDEIITILSGKLITVTYEFGPALYLIEINVNQFQQLLINLVINSKDAINTSGSITIKTYNYSLEKTYKNYAFNAQPGDYVALSISDTGSGLSEEVKNHIFEPFFTTKQEKGTGLGLFSIYRFMIKYNGFISVKTELGKGTEFTLFFRKHLHN